MNKEQHDHDSEQCENEQNSNDAQGYKNQERVSPQMMNMIHQNINQVLDMLHTK